ncbi:hypothetical protein [Sphingomonas elodea]|uniref:hypothetical protein n=1 Tax=Sphingomonas elodea TaxID=179878 RepID=UPI0002630D7B|nr:hypothetical protein [Sphingomonas elodea]
MSTRHGRGRPLRFVGAVAVGWLGLRTAMLWPAAGELPLVAAVPGSPRPVFDRQRERIPFPGSYRASAHVRTPGGPGISAAPAGAPAARKGAAMLLSANVARRVSAPVVAVPAILPSAFPLPLPLPPEPQRTQTRAAGFPGTPIPTVTPPPRRFQLSSWLVLRPGMGIGAAPGAGQLGGSQYGVRLVHGLDIHRHLGAYARLAGPLRGRGAEAAFGIEWQPGDVPVRLTVEHRLGLDGAAGGPALGLVAGIDRRMAPGLRLEAYGQAGAVRRSTTEPYADGALRLTREVMAGDKVALALGAGAWGAAQREAQRLDVGPTAIATLPIGGTQVRVALDWRQRIAGRARPGSGVALTLGSDF